MRVYIIPFLYYDSDINGEVIIAYSSLFITVVMLFNHSVHILFQFFSSVLTETVF